MVHSIDRRVNGLHGFSDRDNCLTRVRQSGGETASEPSCTWLGPKTREKRKKRKEESERIGGLEGRITDDICGCRDRSTSTRTAACCVYDEE